MGSFLIGHMEVRYSLLYVLLMLPHHLMNEENLKTQKFTLHSDGV